jgi:hypothetical protein
MKHHEKIKEKQEKNWLHPIFLARHFNFFLNNFHSGTLTASCKKQIQEKFQESQKLLQLFTHMITDFVV